MGSLRMDSVQSVQRVYYLGNEIDRLRHLTATTAKAVLSLSLASFQEEENNSGGSGDGKDEHRS